MKLINYFKDAYEEFKVVWTFLNNPNENSVQNLIDYIESGRCKFSYQWYERYGFTHYSKSGMINITPDICGLEVQFGIFGGLIDCSSEKYGISWEDGKRIQKAVENVWYKV
jgi:hypothetical protein